MRALLFDAQEIFRNALRHILLPHTEFAEVLEARSAREFVSLATDPDDIDLIIAYPASVGLTEPEGIHLAHSLLAGTDMILFRDGGADGAAHCDGVAFLNRSAGLDAFLTAVDQFTGMAIPGGLEDFPHYYADSHNLGSAICRGLSRRQKQIMAMVAEGLANKEIAARLGIAEGTVKAHIHAVFKALGVTNRTQAVVRYGGHLRQAPASIGHVI